MFLGLSCEIGWLPVLWLWNNAEKDRGSGNWQYTVAVRKAN
jgi:hypothetical protein